MNVIILIMKTRIDSIIQLKLSGGKWKHLLEGN